jgi:hypothetical protein
LVGDEDKKFEGRLTGEVMLMLLNRCCTGVTLAGAFDFTGLAFGEGISSSLISALIINKCLQ